MKMILSQKQQLKLHMTTQLRQSIELLQYSHEDLAQFIREQALSNPLIELKDTTPIQRKSGHFDDVLPSIAAEKDFREELLQEIQCMIEDPTLLYACQMVIHSLDDNGYLQQDIIMTYNIEQSLLTSAINELQKYGPPGIAAISLKHCLLLQLRQMTPKNRIAEAIVTYHLENVANGQFDDIEKALHITKPVLRRAIRTIKSLEPKPCRSLFSKPAATITPDATITLTKEGFSFQLNEQDLPTITLSTAYDDLFTHAEAADFLKAQFKRYEWLTQSIAQRRQTLTRLLQAVVSHQQAFFRQGYVALKPLLLKDIAAQLGVHESTISRATKNKWLATPFGTVALRTLFTNAADERGTSQTAIKVHIEHLIQSEDKTRPLSDQKICELLHEKQNISLARRTITKYRDELSIPSASKRKQLI